MLEFSTSADEQRTQFVSDFDDEGWFDDFGDELDEIDEETFAASTYLPMGTRNGGEVFTRV